MIRQVLFSVFFFPLLVLAYHIVRPSNDEPERHVSPSIDVIDIQS